MDDQADHHPIPFYEMHALLGAIITGWSAIDRAIIVSLNHFRRDENFRSGQFEMFKAPRKFQNRWQLFCKFVKEADHDEHAKELMKAIGKKLRPVRTLRDHIAHGLVRVEPSDGEVNFRIMPPPGNDIVVATASTYLKSKGDLLSALREMEAIASAIDAASMIGSRPELGARLIASLDIVAQDNLPDGD